MLPISLVEQSDWNLHSIPIAFEYMSGSHTGVRIKQQYDYIVEKFGIK
jgi:hypothetical protein